LSVETLAFTEELEKLDGYETEIDEDVEKLRDFILSDEFLEDRVEFEKLLGGFQGNLVTYVETAERIFQTPIILPQQAVSENRTEEGEQKESGGSSWFSFGKVVVAVASMILCYGAVKMEWLPQDVLLWFLAATVGLMFTPPIIKEAAKALQKQPVEQQPIKKQLEVISATLSNMRERYKRTWLRVRVHSQTAYPEFEVRGIPEELYVRRKQLSVQLSHQFLGEIYKIVNDCKETIWSRRSVLHFAIAQARQGATAERAAIASRR
jgi:hypothetical protein